MLVFGGRLLLIAALAWFYEAGVFLYGGGWPNVAWSDLFSMIGGSYGIDMVESNFRTPTAFFHAPIGTSCFAMGLPIFLFGLVGFGDKRNRKTV